MAPLRISLEVFRACEKFSSALFILRVNYSNDIDFSISGDFCYLNVQFRDIAFAKFRIQFENDDGDTTYVRTSL